MTLLKVGKQTGADILETSQQLIDDLNHFLFGGQTNRNCDACSKELYIHFYFLFHRGFFPTRLSAHVCWPIGLIFSPVVFQDLKNELGEYIWWLLLIEKKNKKKKQDVSF